MKWIIAIDGYAGCGKSTLAKALAKEHNLLYIDSGAMYRAITYYFLEQKLDWQNLTSLSEVLSEVDLDFHQVGQERHIFLNGKDIEEKIRTMEINKLVSPVAANGDVRAALVKLQRSYAATESVVMDGRDIGTVVFPNANMKIFLVASPEIRASRRFMEMRLKNPELSIDVEEVKENLLSRDEQDSTREISPLTKAEDAYVIDNTYLNQDEQAFLIQELMSLVKDA